MDLKDCTLEVYKKDCKIYVQVKYYNLLVKSYIMNEKDTLQLSGIFLDISVENAEEIYL